MRVDRTAPAWRVAVACAAAFVVLTILVATHTMDHLDTVLRDRFRPHDEWGPWQRRADHVVQALRPAVMAVFFTMVAIGWSIYRRSRWPLAYAALIGLSAACVTQVTKLLLARPDPHGQVKAHSGGFPSGHTVSVLICLGGALLLVRLTTRWWQWLFVGLVASTMGLALLVEAAHWFTDVVGGALLAVTVLAAASVSSWRALSAGSSQQDPGGPDRASLGDGAAHEEARQP